MFFYPELPKKLIRLSSKDIIPLRKLYEYVEREFKTYNEYAIDEQLKRQDKSIGQQHELIQQQNEMIEIQTESNKTTKRGLLIASIGIIISFFASWIIPSFTTSDIKIEEPIKMETGTILNTRITNDSLKVSMKKDTTKIIINNSISPIK